MRGRRSCPSHRSHFISQDDCRTLDRFERNELHELWFEIRGRLHDGRRLRPARAGFAVAMTGVVFGIGVAMSRARCGRLLGRVVPVRCRRMMIVRRTVIVRRRTMIRDARSFSRLLRIGEIAQELRRDEKSQPEDDRQEFLQSHSRPVPCHGDDGSPSLRIPSTLARFPAFPCAPWGSGPPVVRTTTRAGCPNSSASRSGGRSQFGLDAPCEGSSISSNYSTSGARP